MFSYDILVLFSTHFGTAGCPWSEIRGLKKWGAEEGRAEAAVSTMVDRKRIKL